MWLRDPGAAWAGACSLSNNDLKPKDAGRCYLSRQSGPTTRPWRECHNDGVPPDGQWKMDGRHESNHERKWETITLLSFICHYHYCRVTVTLVFERMAEAIRKVIYTTSSAAEAQRGCRSQHLNARRGAADTLEQ